MVYTPAQLVNFTVVPAQFRFVFISAVSLVWSASPSVSRLEKCD